MKLNHPTEKKSTELAPMADRGETALEALSAFGVPLGNVNVDLGEIIIGDGSTMKPVRTRTGDGSFPAFEISNERGTTIAVLVDLRRKGIERP